MWHREKKFTRLGDIKCIHIINKWFPVNRCNQCRVGSQITFYSIYVGQSGVGTGSAWELTFPPANSHSINCCKFYNLTLLVLILRASLSNQLKKIEPMFPIIKSLFTEITMNVKTHLLLLNNGIYNNKDHITYSTWTQYRFLYAFNFSIITVYSSHYDECLCPTFVLLQCRVAFVYLLFMKC